MVNHDTELNKNWTPETSRRCSEIQKIINTEVAICTTTIKFRNPLVCITIGFHILRRKKKNSLPNPLKRCFTLERHIAHSLDLLKLTRQQIENLHQRSKTDF